MAPRHAAGTIQEHSVPSNTTLSIFTHCWICTEYQNFPSTFLYCLVLLAWLAETLYATEHHKRSLCFTVSTVLWLADEAQHDVSNQCCYLLGMLQAVTYTYVRRKVVKRKAYVAQWLQQWHNHKLPIWSEFILRLNLTTQLHQTIPAHLLAEKYPTRCW